MFRPLIKKSSFAAVSYWYSVLASMGFLQVVPLAASGEIGFAPALRDVTLHETQTSFVSDGRGQHLYVGRLGENGGGRIRRGLMSFALGDVVPPGSTVTSAVLRLSMSRSSDNTPVSVSVHRVLQAWSEGPTVATSGQGAPSQVGDASWTHARYDDVLWSTPGGSANLTASASAIVGGVGYYEWRSASLLQDVQHGVEHPGNNFGWLVIGGEGQTQTIKRFDARENLSMASRPSLEIGFIPPPEVGATLMTAELSAAAMVPPVGGSALGLARVAYDFDSQRFSVVAQNTVQDGIRFALHGPANPGAVAPRIALLGAAGELAAGAVVLSQAQETSLLDGLCYLQIDSESYPNGALRGQILANRGFAVQLAGKGGGLRLGSSASGVGVFRFDPLSGVLEARILHSLASAASIRFHGPIREDGIAPLLAQAPAFNGLGLALLETNLVLEADAVAELHCGALSVRVLTGVPEIAGFIQTVDSDPLPIMTARLDSHQVVIPVTNHLLGCAICVFDTRTGELEYRMTHSVTNATASFLVGGAGPGTNGNVIASVQALQTSARGKVPLTTSEQADLLKGLTHFSVHTFAF
ncbi:MAG: DNRLRE domain-containing protein, partial [Verrucomicrobia bacterium]|nr:DNRLRE domain-containing protein [Verrucomicrobiota bacterium]